MTTTTAPTTARCADHPAFEADYCPSCGTSTVIGATAEETAEIVARREALATPARPLADVLAEHMEAVTARRATAHGFTIGADVDRAEACVCGAAFFDGFHLDAVKTAHLAAFGIDVTTAPAVGEVVVFGDETPQHSANAGILYRVVPSPSGSGHSIDNTHTEDLGRVYVWLEDTRDAGKPPSRRRTRTGYVTALEVVDEPTPPTLDEVLEHVADLPGVGTVTRNAPALAHISKPRRKRAALLLTAERGDLEIVRFDGHGYIVETARPLTLGDAVDYVRTALR